MSNTRTVDLRQLSFAGQLLVWSTRKWVARDGEWRRVETEFEAPFGPVAGRALAAALNELYSVMNASALRPLVVGPTQCGRLWQDEGLIVSLVELEQARQSGWAMTLLERVLPEAAARQAIAHVAHIACLLEDAGYLVAIDGQEAATSHTPTPTDTAPDPSVVKVTIH